jgi:RNA polymerase sigma-70 factor (ECF subfamily)
VFLKATHQLDSSRTEASVASWLFTVARTVLADHWRRFYRAPPPLALDDLVVADAPHHLAEETSGEGSERLVQTVLRSLPPRYRRTLELRFLYGYSIDEAAAEMNVTSGNLKILQHRALARAASLGFPDLEESGRATPLHRADRDDLQDGYSSLRPEERTLP